MTKVSVLTLMITLKGMMALEWDKERGGRVKRQWGESKRWCVQVFILAVLQAIVWRGRCLRGCCTTAPPHTALGHLSKRFVFSSPGSSGERVQEKKGAIVSLGATGPLWTQPVLSLDLWPILFWGFSFGEGRQLGELREGWWTAGPILGREGERERQRREWGHEIERGCMRGKGGISLFGGGRKKSGGEEGRAGEVTKGLCAHSQVCPPCSCVSGSAKGWHIALHTDGRLACEKVLAEFAWRTPSLCLRCFVTAKKKKKKRCEEGRKGVEEGGCSQCGLSSWVQIHEWVDIRINPRKLWSDTRLQKIQRCGKVWGSWCIMAERDFHTVPGEKRWKRYSCRPISGIHVNTEII